MNSFLRNRKVQIAGQAVVITALVGGTSAFVAMNKPVNMTVDGQAEQVRTFGGTVGDVLEAQGLEIDERDLVQPGAGAPIERDMNIVVNTAKDLNLTVDGVALDEWTTANTVGQALADLGIEAEGAEVSLPLDEPLSEDGAELDVVTPKGVTVVADGKKHVVDSATATVSDVLAEAGVEVGGEDIVSVPVSAPVSDGQVVNVLRVKNETKTVEEKIEKKVTVKETASLDRGKTKIEQQGKDGKREVVYDIRVVDGDEVKKVKKSEKTVEEPVEEVVLKGTRVQEAPSRSDDRASDSNGSDSGSSSSGDSESSKKESGGSGGSDSSDKKSDGDSGAKDPAVANGATWDKLAQCESGGNWSINTGNGYYGGLQFSSQTWGAFGGHKYAPNAHQASRAQQIDIASKVQKQQGWGAWPACSSKLGLR
ncbi:resuscitation-promoting factor [Brevibacterium daeguense]|uniref:Resuscitation-promoting factor n=3 Tax=Brevibacterium daeguense TaxID=909936 RepID=A0ABP8EG73_9MICO